jgi:hypothetical protein
VSNLPTLRHSEVADAVGQLSTAVVRPQAASSQPCQLEFPKRALLEAYHSPAQFEYSKAVRRAHAHYFPSYSSSLL